MNYYTSLIPLPLAEKLKEKGMHQLVDSRMEDWLNSGDNITYAEVFDWLMEKGYAVNFYPLYDGIWLRWWRARIYDLVMDKNENMGLSHTWHEAAERAIKKALELI